MSTTVDVSTRWWWVAPELALVVVAVLASAYLPAPTPRGALRAQVTARATTAVERLTPADHSAHGHDLTADRTRIACVAELMGYAPAGAARLADVETAYLYYQCAAGAPGQPYDQAALLAGPAAVDLGRQPPVARVPGAGPGYAQRLLTLIPPEYHAWAIDGFHDPAVAASLPARYATP